MRNKRKIAGILVAIGVVFYIVDLVVYVPRFGAFTHALQTWNHTTTPAFPDPAAYGLDNTAFIISPILGGVAAILVLIGGGYLLAVLVANVARRLGYLEKAEITKEDG